MADKLNLLTLTATEAQSLLQSGTLTSVQLVQIYLSQIALHNHSGLHLNALISISPESLLLQTASDLDAERSAGHLRSPLHGIPLILKDCFLTSTQSTALSTTCGSPCLATATSAHNSPLVQNLVNAGMILLGKANMTEFCGLKMKGLTPGWSPLGGQTQSPYVFGGLEANEVLLGNSSPGGSSSGSAVGVAASFAPLSLGTETVGSVVTPANRAGLYALKCTQGAVDVSGNFNFSDCVDCVGVMAKCASDVALLTALVMKVPEPFNLQENLGFSGLRVGVLAPESWNLPPEVTVYPGETNKTMEDGFWVAMDGMEKAGADLTTIELELPWDVFSFESGKDFRSESGSENGSSTVETDTSTAKASIGEKKSLFYEVCMEQLRNTHLPAFLSQLTTSEVRSLEELTAWNEQHAALTMPPDHPSQHELTDLLDNHTTPSQGRALATELRRRGTCALAPLFSTVDVLVALGDSPLCMYAAAAGYPIATAPLGMLKYSERNSRPYGLCYTAMKGGEGILMRFMRACEQGFAARGLPEPLVRDLTIGDSALLN